MRASALKVGKFDEAEEIEEKMTQFKNTHLEELMRP